MILLKLVKKIIRSLDYRGRRALDSILRAMRVSMVSRIEGEVVRVEQFMPEGDSEYELYQKFYENSLREQVRFVQTKLQNGFAEHTTHVGQYIFHLRDGGVRNVAFDAHDHRDIRSKAIHEWSDIYLKSNRWPGIDYGPKVQPIPIGHAGITLENCRYLRSLRGAKKELDLLFVGRIWAGGDANVEHNLRLFESLAKVKCKSKLLAVVFNFDKQSEEFRIIARRLNEAGVEMTDRQIGYGDLMKMSASSKLVVLRAGISGCIAWRMVDMLGMGACLVLDQSPFPEWPVPLKEGTNFFNLGTRITADCRPAPEEDYARIPEMVYSFLQNHETRARIKSKNREYFDQELKPLVMGFKVMQATLKLSK
jgi:hypothetical protein